MQPVVPILMAANLNVSTASAQAASSRRRQPHSDRRWRDTGNVKDWDYFTQRGLRDE